VPVDEAEELRRVIPVVSGPGRAHARARSASTRQARVAAAALACGATLVNDVSAGRADARMLATVAEARAGYVVMHMLGTPRDMQVDPRYDDVWPK
jgi:dihydropteroate synthase